MPPQLWQFYYFYYCSSCFVELEACRNMVSLRPFVLLYQYVKEQFDRITRFRGTSQGGSLSRSWASPSLLRCRHLLGVGCLMVPFHNYLPLDDFFSLTSEFFGKGK